MTPRPHIGSRTTSPASMPPARASAHDTVGCRPAATRHHWMTRHRRRTRHDTTRHHRMTRHRRIQACDDTPPSDDTTPSNDATQHQLLYMLSTYDSLPRHRNLTST
eukprot:4422132-Pyramimonas_sp.AAC.1